MLVFAGAAQRVSLGAERCGLVVERSERGLLLALFTGKGFLELLFLGGELVLARLLERLVAGAEGFQVALELVLDLVEAEVSLVLVSARFLWRGSGCWPGRF